MFVFHALSIACLAESAYTSALTSVLGHFPRVFRGKHNGYTPALTAESRWLQDYPPAVVRVSFNESPYFKWQLVFETTHFVGGH